MTYEQLLLLEELNSLKSEIDLRSLAMFLEKGDQSPLFKKEAARILYEFRLKLDLVSSLARHVGEELAGC